MLRFRRKGESTTFFDAVAILINGTDGFKEFAELSSLTLKLQLDARAFFFLRNFVKLKRLRRALDSESLRRSEGVHAVGALGIGRIVRLTLSLTVLYPWAKLSLPSKDAARTKAAFVLLLCDPGHSVPCQGAQTLCYSKKEAGCRALEEEDAEAVGLKVLEQKNRSISFNVALLTF